MLIGLLIIVVLCIVLFVFGSTDAYPATLTFLENKGSSFYEWVQSLNGLQGASLIIVLCAIFLYTFISDVLSTDQD